MKQIFLSLSLFIITFLFSNPSIAREVKCFRSISLKKLRKHKCTPNETSRTYQFTSNQMSDQQRDSFTPFSESNNQIEIGACFSDESMSFRIERIVILEGKLSKQAKIIPYNCISSKNLDDALFFENDLDNFSITAKLSSNRKFILKNKANDARILTGNFYKKSSGDTFIPENPKEFIGTLELGSDFILCEYGTPTNVFIKINDAKIEFSYCNKNMMGTPGGFKGEVIKVSVIDDSEILSDTNRNEKFAIDKEQFSEKFLTKVHRHNICDSFKIKLPHATYIFTSGPAGIAGADEKITSCTFENSVFLPNPKPSSGTFWDSVYKIIYHEEGNDVKEVSGRAPYMHHLKNNYNF
jgi:hypothetical protein